MDKFKVIKKLGDGLYGSVWRASNKHTGEIVAVKVMKTSYSSWKECLNLREYKSLRNMNHTNIVKLKELIMENNHLYFAFENLDHSLFQVMEDRSKHLFTESEIIKYCFQLFNGLAYMHQQGYIHRDLKPDNLLVSESREVIKLADFGMVREIGSKPPFTEYVTTRWYRAPEVLLRAKSYGCAIDMWAMGAIMAELFTFEPLFPGSSDGDQMYKICRVLGSPTENEWAEGVQLARDSNYQFPKVKVGGAENLSRVIPWASEDAISLIRSLCSWDPCKRPTALEALKHPFFRSCYEYVHPPIHSELTLDLKMAPPSGDDFLGNKTQAGHSKFALDLNIMASPSSDGMDDFGGNQTPLHSEFTLDLNATPPLVV